MKPRRVKKQKPGGARRRADGSGAVPAGRARLGEHERQPQQPRAADALQKISIEKPIYGGAFLARAEGKTVFVPLALPGEQVNVRIAEEKRGYATAEIDERLTTAPERVPAPCPYFGACGGCQYQHAGYEAQLRYKQAILRETLERGGVRPSGEIAVLSGEPWAYRNRIRLAFDAAGNPGYRGRRSHDVISIAECPIAAPLLVKMALEFADITRRSAFKPKEISLFCDAAESALLMTVFTERPVKIRLDETAGALGENIPTMRGIEMIAQDRHHAPRTYAQWGETSLLYHAAGFDYRVDHGAFFQVNRWLVDPLVQRVVEGRGGKLVWDLFAGVGLFARALAASFDRVMAVESAPAATDALAHNLTDTRAQALRSSTLEFLRRHGRNSVVPDVIVVDPPRTGLGAETTTLLAEIGAPAIVYVSCDPATLARDLRVLVASGYAIDRITMADLFPQTFHLETIVDLRR